MIYLSNGASCMILSHANQMECSKQALTVLEGLDRLFLGDDDGGAANLAEHLA